MGVVTVVQELAHGVKKTPKVSWEDTCTYYTCTSDITREGETAIILLTRGAAWSESNTSKLRRPQRTVPAAHLSVQLDQLVRQRRRKAILA